MENKNHLEYTGKDRNMLYCLDLLEQGAASLGISLSEKQKEQFVSYYEFLIEKNQVMNLTAITEFEDVLLKHFLDSLTCVKVLNPEDIKTVMDVGTGAGFPGIPLKIVFPHLKVTLLDSLNKRINFLNETCSRLQLTNIQTIHGRAEDFAQNKDYRETYDLCVSRAVSNLSTLSEYCLPYVKEGGIFISYKSGKVQEEVRAGEYAVKVLGGKIDNLSYFTLPGSEMERSLVVIKKIRRTPRKYPRKAGIPQKTPL